MGNVELQQSKNTLGITQRAISGCHVKKGEELPVTVNDGSQLTR